MILQTKSYLVDTFFNRKDGSLSIEGTYDIVTSFDVPLGVKSYNF